MAQNLDAFVNAPEAPIAGTRYMVNAVVADRVNRLIAEAPPDVQGDLRRAITSGYRTHEQQMRAYLHHLAGGGLAAPPGHSWHERAGGMAVDWNGVSPRAWQYLKANAGRFGMAFPLGSADPFHSQPVETVAGGINHLASARIGRVIHAPPVPPAFADLHADAGPPLPIAPINPVPPPSVTDTALGRTITTSPVKLTPEPKLRPLSPGPTHSSPIGHSIRNALAGIMRTR